MRMNIRMMAGSILDGKLWFSASNCNAIFRFDLSDSTLSLIDDFEAYDIHMENIHRECTVYEDWIIFIPQMSNRIDFYNIKTGEKTSLVVSQTQINKSFASAEIFNKRLYLLPMNAQSSPRVVNLDTRQFEDNTIFEKIILEEQKKTNGDLVFTRGCISDGIIYAGIYNTNYYIEYNCKKDSLITHITDINDIYFVQKGNNGIWIVGISGEIEYLQHDSEPIIYDTKANGLKKRQWAYNRLFEYNGAGIVIPAYEKHILRLADGKKEIITYPDSFQKRMVNEDWVLFFNGAEYNNKIYIYPFAYPEMLVLEEDKLSSNSMIYEMDEELDDYRKNYIKELYSVDGKEVLFEQAEYLTLKDYIRLF